MKKIFAGTLIAIAAATTLATLNPSRAAQAPVEIDDAVVNAKIDARLHQQLRAALAERLKARQLATR